MSCAFIDYYNYSFKKIYYILLAAQYEKKKNENSKLEKKFRKFSQPNSLHLQLVHDFSLTQCRTIYETNERKN